VDEKRKIFADDFYGRGKSFKEVLKENGLF
jgi:hypothetical protein